MQATVLAVHEGMVPYLERGRTSPTAVCVVRNPVTPWRSERVRAEQNRDVFFVGRLEEDKGILQLAKAARLAGAPLRILGDGALKGVIARDYPEAMLMGWRSRDEIAEIIGHARLLVVPTCWREAFGLVALEAAMSGIPLIVSTFALISDEVVKHGFGLACNPYDIETMAKMIACLISDDALTQDMSLLGFTQARQLAPTPEQWCDDLIEIYARKIQRRIHASN
jgi:glycosyltransferase involved in cell wall biosynthesis